MDFEALYFKMVHYKKQLFLVGAILAVVLGALAFIPQKKKDLYLMHTQAAQAFFAWSKDPLQNQTDYKTLLQFAQKHAQIGQWYVKPIVQHLLAWGKGDEARKLYKSVEQREGLSEWGKFSLASIDIASGKWKQALSKKGEISDSLPLLKAFSLIRTAMLCQALNKAKEELLAWGAFEQFYETVPQAQAEINRLLPSRENRSIFDYIKEREELLAHSH